MYIVPRAWRDQPIDQTEPNLASRLAEIRAKVVCCSRRSQLIATTQPPGSRLPASRVATHGKRVGGQIYYTPYPQQGWLTLVAFYDKQERRCGPIRIPGTTGGDFLSRMDI
jgi:hypothetical protein